MAIDSVTSLHPVYIVCVCVGNTAHDGGDWLRSVLSRCSKMSRGGDEARGSLVLEDVPAMTDAASLSSSSTSSLNATGRYMRTPCCVTRG